MALEELFIFPEWWIYVQNLHLCRYFIIYPIFTCVDPDPYWEYGSGSGSTKLLNTDPIGIWIHNTCSLSDFLKVVEDSWCVFWAVWLYFSTVQESGSISSTVSDASTEPWFCEPCRANLRDPTCRVCPNVGGIYKVNSRQTVRSFWCKRILILGLPNIVPCGFI